jgi:hypothetical protein
MTPIRCPECASPLCLSEATTTEVFHPGYHVRGTPLPTRDRATVIAACSGCEFVYELTADEQVLYRRGDQT